MDAQSSPEPRPTFAPAARSAALGGSVETTGSLARQVTIYLLDAAESSTCPFWIGLAGPGPQSAPNEGQASQQKGKGDGEVTDVDFEEVK